LIFAPVVYSLADGRPALWFEGQPIGSLHWIVGGLEEMESGITLYTAPSWDGSFPEVPQAVFVYSSFFALAWSTLFFAARTLFLPLQKVESTWMGLRDK
jgi:hypothetical protein